MTEEHPETSSLAPSSAVAPVTAPLLDPDPPSPPGTPYRSAPGVARPAVPSRRAVLLGAGLHVSGVLLWAFVVMGELTTSYGPGKRQMLVGEALAVVFVLATTAAAWAASLRRSVETVAPTTRGSLYGRGVFIAVVAVALWLVAINLAVAFGKTSPRTLDGPITLFLLIVAAAAALGGRRLQGPRRQPRPGRARTIRALLWAGAALLTSVTLVEVLAS